MNIAMTVWGDRVSPVLDCARTLLVAEIVQGRILSRNYQRFDIDSLAGMMRILVRQGVGVLICGAVSQEPANTIEGFGIKLMPFLAGDAEKILETLARGLSVEAFTMPGCRCYGRCRMSPCASRKKMRGRRG
jgi:predicted Fe-Mo cluster-binding NifX family protein